MRTFLLNVGGFIILFGLGQWAIGQWYHSEIAPFSLSERKESQLDTLSRPLKLFFFGDSHVERAVDPRSIANSFNYSSSGENYFQTYYKLRKLQSEGRMKELEAAIFPLELHSFSSFLQTQVKDDAYWAKFLDYTEYAHQSEEPQLLAKMFKGKFLPHLGGIENVYFILRKGFQHQDIIFGYLPSDLSLDERAAFNDPGRASFHFEDRQVPDPFLVKYFINCLQLCQQEGLNIYLIRYPIHKSYLEQSRMFLNQNKYVAFEDSLLKALDIKLKVLDFRNFGSSNSEWFRDSDHLNRKGATVFSELLNTELQN